MSTSELSTSSSWSSAAERIRLQGRRVILQALGRRSVVSAAAVADEHRADGGSIRGGAGAAPPQRRDSSGPAPAPAAAARLGPTGSGTGDADDALLDAPSPSPGLTAEMALSILVDCFGH